MEFSLEQGIQKGRPLPDWAVDSPGLLPDDQFYMMAFKRLHTDRQIGMGLGPIPWSSILAYAKLYGLGRAMIDVFAHVIMTMDEAYRKWHDEKVKTEKDK